MRTQAVRRVWLSLGLLFLSGACVADNWPNWRGAEMSGQCREKGLPVTWSTTENVRWKVALPGPGFSSPIVWADRVFLTQSLDKDGHQRALMCVNRKDGKLLWQKVTPYPEKESTYQPEPHYCSASPATDGERVVASFGSGGLVCYDLNGNLLWKRDFGKCEQIWGNASSPVMYKDLVIHNFGPGERTFLMALNKRTGKDVWKVDVPGGAFGDKQPEWNGSWSTPVIARFKDHDELIMSWPEVLSAYDPTTGKSIWSCKGLGRLAYTSPLVTPDLIVYFSGFGGPSMAVKTGGKGDVTDSHRLWHETKSTQRIGSGVIIGEHLYIVNANGTAQCIELKTGNTLWTERATDSTWGSMVCADGRLYVTSQKGETVVLAAKPTFEVLARNALGERSNSSPAISNGDILIRTYDHLWCIANPRSSRPSL